MKKSLLTKVELICEFLSACFKPTEVQTGKIYNYPHMPYCEVTNIWNKLWNTNLWKTIYVKILTKDIIFVPASSFRKISCIKNHQFRSWQIITSDMSSMLDWVTFPLSSTTWRIKCPMCPDNMSEWHLNNIKGKYSLSTSRQLITQQQLVDDRSRIRSSFSNLWIYKP